MIFLGETVCIEAIIKDFVGNLVDPEKHEIEIYDPSGSLMATFTAPIREDKGKYYICYTLPQDGLTGLWKAVWKVTANEIIEKEEIDFFVEENG